MTMADPESFSEWLAGGRREKRIWVVTHRKSAVVTDLVEATSAAEAVRLVKEQFVGERAGFEIDETRSPTSWLAIPDDRSPA